MTSTIKRILDLSGEYKSRVLIGLFCNVLKSFSMAGMFMGVFYVIFNLQNLSMDVVKNAFFIELISVIGRFVFQWLVDIFATAAGYDVFMNYRLDVGNKLKKAPMGYFSETKLSDIQMIMTTTLGSLEMYAMFTICNITGAFAMSAFMIIMFAFYSWHMALLSLVGLVTGYIVLQSVQRRAHRHTLELEKAEAEMISSVMEYTRGIGVLRSHVNAKSGQSDVLSKFEKKRNADYTQEKAMSGVLRRYQMVYKLIGGAMVVLSGSLYFSGILNMNEAIVYMIASFFVYSEIENMGDSAFLSMRINNQLERLDRIVDIPEVEESSSPIRFKNGDIEFENVSFAYDEEMILKNIDIKVKNKSKTAIVGPSGSGKTTLCKLIGRFWDVSEGKVLIGKNDIRDYEYSDLMNNISMVFQNVYLFRDTIRSNIAFGSENASDEEIIAAAKSACCHDFIMDLPDGYDTVIGEGGSSLSGGEKQRISIARAILKDAPIIIFDEATSSIDPENEALLVEAMTKLSRGKTVITIAHKLSTIQNADEIIVIEEGKIVQRGEHDKLASEKGVYSRFLDAVRKSENWSIK